MMNLRKAKGQDDMAKSDNNTPVKNDEFSRIFDEYRAKIDEITRRTEKNLHPADTPSDNGNGKGSEPVVAVASEESTGPENNSVDVNWRPDKAAEKIINEAKLEAQRIIADAEEDIKREARKKTQTKVDKIIEKARKDSEDIIENARQEADKEREEIATSSKREAEQLIKTITDEYRAETQAQSTQVIAQAKDTAENILADVVASSTEISQLIANMVNRARETINELEKSLQSEMDELNRIIRETQARMEQVAISSSKKHANKPASDEKKERKPASDSEEIQIPEETELFVKFKGEKTNGNNGKGPLYSGQMELKAISSFEYKQVRNIKNHLVTFPNIKYMQEYASEKEMSVLFEIKEPLPLLDIFNDLPLVDKVAAVDDGINLTLKNH
jgi:vacuolar-type H+-ATPase subunit H